MERSAGTDQTDRHSLPYTFGSFLVTKGLFCFRAASAQVLLAGVVAPSRKLVGHVTLFLV